MRIRKQPLFEEIFQFHLCEHNKTVFGGFKLGNVVLRIEQPLLNIYFRNRI